MQLISYQLFQFYLHVRTTIHSFLSFLSSINRLMQSYGNVVAVAFFKNLDEFIGLHSLTKLMIFERNSHELEI